MIQTTADHIGREGPTNPCLIDANIKGINQIFQEHADQPEVEPTDTPGPVHQDHDVCNGLSVANKLINYEKETRHTEMSFKLTVQC